MILCSLTLENFKRYKHISFEFSEGLTGIVGKNGSGKSTIFDAIYFALFGEVRNNAKTFVRNANSDEKTVVSVELVFEIESNEYKIVREFRGKALSAKAYLYDYKQELIASGAKEVDLSVVKLIGMEKSAFLHTVFASQKELTSLSLLDNEARKKMIRKLLGLEKIDAIEQKIRNSITDINRELKVLNTLLLSLDEVETLQSKQKAQEELLNAKQKEIQNNKKEAEALNVLYEETYKQLQLLNKQKSEYFNLQKELSLIVQNIENLKNNIEKNKKELESLNLLEKEYEQKKRIKQTFSQLEEALKRIDTQKEGHLKKEGLFKEQNRLREEFKHIRHEINTLHEQQKDEDKIQEKYAVLTQQLITSKEKVLKIEKLERKLNDEIAGLNSLISQHKQRIDKLEDLGKESACPTCTRPLLDEYDNVLKSLSSEIRDVYVKDIEYLQLKLHDEVVKRQEQEELQKKLEKEHTQCKLELNLIEDVKKRVQNSELHLKKIEEVGKKNNDELATITTEAYDKTLHDSLIEQKVKVQKEYEHILQLEQSLKAVPKLNEELNAYEESLIQIKQKKVNTTHLIENHIYKQESHTLKEQAYEKLKEQRNAHYEILKENEKENEKMMGEINILKSRLSENAKHISMLSLKQNDVNDYEKLKVNLNEFKTKINAKIAPRISQIASDMFSSITKGKYQHIEVTNDFDFYIYDESKAYPIERFSGGEIDLANLVLRIAISKTLSELSGAKRIGFLAFDEVFGSQDESRRVEILEAFQIIKEQYRQIFLISHEMEIKEMFERIIEL